MFYKKNQQFSTILLALCLSSVVAIAGATSFRLGDKSAEVKVIQQQLNANGYKVQTDGVYTKDTQKAVYSFQQKKRISADGIVGPVTYKALFGKEMNGPVAENRKSLQFGHDGPFTTEAVNSPEKIKKLLAFARQYTGVPYRFGGTTPSGFDCSGYINFVFRNAAGMSLPRSADQQYGVGKSIAKNKLEPGDLVFFETYTSGVSHSGIYVGNNKFISATSSRGVVEADMSGGYWSEHYIGAKRVL